LCVIVANRANKDKHPSLLSELHVPLLILGAFVLGAGGMWIIMRSSSPSSAPAKPRIEAAATPAMTSQPPNVSNLAPADAERALADWNYDHQNWPHAIDHYQQAIAKGADNPDVRTDLGNCFRFSGQPQKALEQYKIAQTQNPMHENSLFNQAGLLAEVLHDDQQAVAIAREFLTRFPNSSKAESAKQLIAHIQADGNRP
jgi:tetratricopeptide (TPR) repeat protein